ncbi:MAG: hypothetical protein ACTHMD_09575 [Flavisolibacter sp.]
MQNADVFQLDFKGAKIDVQRHTLAGTQVIYRIVFFNGRPPLTITRAMGMSIGMHWTSIPEGRRPEAEKVGKLISEYIKTLS